MPSSTWEAKTGGLRVLGWLELHNDTLTKELEKREGERKEREEEKKGRKEGEKERRREGEAGMGEGRDGYWIVP